jgi:hypothetical protein
VGGEMFGRFAQDTGDLIGDRGVGGVHETPIFR